MKFEANFDSQAKSKLKIIRALKYHKFIRVIRFFVLELSVLGVSRKILSRTCPGQIFSFPKPSPKTLNPSSFFPHFQDKNFLWKKVKFITREFRVFFLRPGQFQDKFLQDTPRTDNSRTKNRIAQFIQGNDQL